MILDMMEIIITLLNESRISKYVKDTGKHDSLYAEVKTLGENVKSKLDVSADLDEIATRNFLSKAQKLLTEVWKYKTEEERIEKKTYLNALKDAGARLSTCQLRFVEVSGWSIIIDKDLMDNSSLIF